MDKYSPVIRSKMMKAVKSKNTNLENFIADFLWKSGVKYRRNTKSLKGKPDFSLKKYKIVLFIDSCFWHGCEEHCRMPKSNISFWNAKIKKNKFRDKQVTEYYLKQNWTILRIWEHDILNNEESIKKKILFTFQTVGAISLL